MVVQELAPSVSVDRTVSSLPTFKPHLEYGLWVGSWYFRFCGDDALLLAGPLALICLRHLGRQPDASSVPDGLEAEVLASTAMATLESSHGVTNSVGAV